MSRLLSQYGLMKRGCSFGPVQALTVAVWRMPWLVSGTGFTKLPLQCWQRGAAVPSGPYSDPGDQSLSVRLPLQVQVACSADARSNTQR